MYASEPSSRTSPGRGRRANPSDEVFFFQRLEHARQILARCHDRARPLRVLQRQGDAHRACCIACVFGERHADEAQRSIAC
jgi:hypothetical protein